MAREKFQTLTEQMFYILLCLREECCGMDSMETVRGVTGGRVTIAKGVWEVDPGFVKNGTEVVFEAGAELVANPGGFFGKNDCVLTVQAQTCRRLPKSLKAYRHLQLLPLTM